MPLSALHAAPAYRRFYESKGWATPLAVPHCYVVVVAPPPGGAGSTPLSSPPPVPPLGCCNLVGASHRDLEDNAHQLLDGRASAEYARAVDPLLAGLVSELSTGGAGATGTRRGVLIRRATPGDIPALHAIWSDFSEADLDGVRASVRSLDTLLTRH